MRTLFLSSTLAFWITVAAFWAGGTWWPGAGGGQATAADREIAAAEVARHAVPKDCWMIIDGRVYDVTRYLPNHPVGPSMVVPWCGKDASEAYCTKNAGRPHTAYADQLLPAYRIGTLAH